MTGIFVALGSNVGDRIKNLDAAVASLAENKAVTVTQQSQTYETAPVGLKEQPDFLNRVIEVETTLMPIELLDLMQSIEKKQGREREIHDGPRVIDLDLLLYRDWIHSTSRLKLPHPRMHERRFVLVPLLELDRELRSPRNGRSYREHLEGIDQEDQPVEVFSGE